MNLFVRVPVSNIPLYFQSFIAHRHVLFTSPKVGDIVQLLLDQSEKVGKSDEELLVEATALVKKAFADVLSLDEDAVKDETDFFEVGGSELLLLCLLYLLLIWSTS